MPLSASTIAAASCGALSLGRRSPGKDIENPDPAKKGRPTLGMPILIAMAPTKPNRWEGEIYNSNNGKTYSSNVSMVNENTLKLEGCFLFGLCCGGENWTRVDDAADRRRIAGAADSADASRRTSEEGRGRQ
jgi:uncharacterized protein (DUF2147 family)